MNTMRSVPMPPLEFQTLVSGPGSEPKFEEVGSWLCDALHQQGLLAPGTSFLDIGCGCGRLARRLLSTPIGILVVHLPTLVDADRPNIWWWAAGPIAKDTQA